MREVLDKGERASPHVLDVSTTNARARRHPPQHAALQGHRRVIA